MFLVCGEALFDIFVEEVRDDGLTMEARPGGSPFNVAMGLCRLGQRAALFTGLSGDLLGQRLKPFMEKEGVDLIHAVPVDRPTTVSFIGIAPDGGPAYAFYGEKAADRSVGEGDLPAIGPDVAAVHVGSFSTAVAPIGPALKTLADREKVKRLISYDPNIRLTVEPSLDTWRGVFRDFSAAAHLLKVSREDLDALFPGVATGDIVSDCLGRGVRLMVVTDGAQGATAWTRHTTATCPATPVSVIDTVGAGDTFQAALLARLAETDALTPDALDALDSPRLRALLNFAARAAAITCSRRGADLPHRSELEQP